MEKVDKLVFKVDKCLANEMANILKILCAGEGI